MKKLYLYFSGYAGIFLTLLLSANVSQANAEITIIKNSQAQAKIYISGSLKPTQFTKKELEKLPHEQRLEKVTFPQIRKDMVDELNYHLKKMTGTALEVVLTDDTGKVKAPAIILGELAVNMGVKSKHSTFNRETSLLKTRDGKVFIGGESPVGTRNGIYDLLRHLGVDWVMPGTEGEIIPQRKNVVIPELDENLTPDFVVRAPWYSGGNEIITADDRESFDRWKIRMKSTTSLYDKVLHPKWLQGGHYWHKIISKHKKLLEQRPELMALVEVRSGVYTTGKAQLESTHPEVLDLIVQDIKEMFEKNEWAKDKTVALSVGPNDGGGYSVSPMSLAVSSRRIDPITGDFDQTDLLVKYTNDLLEKLTPEYPNLYLGWYLYSVHSDYPLRYKPHPNLVISIADITQSRNQATTDETSRSRTYLRRVLNQWKRLHEEQGNIIWYYGYNWNLAENLMPYTKVRIYGQDIPYYKSVGVLGHNQESDKAWSILGPHNHLLARMSWDTTLNWKAELKNYCTKAFGRGGPPMEEYFKLVDRRQLESGATRLRRDTSSESTG